MNIFKVNGKFNLGDLIISLLITLGGGYVIGKFTQESVQVYGTLNKPWFSPPAIVFPYSMDYFIYTYGNSSL